MKYSKSGINWKHNSDSYRVYLKDQLPFVKFDKTDIIGIRKEDSIKIEGTLGEFNVNELIWNGKGGKVQWRNVGMEEVYSELADYSISGTGISFNSAPESGSTINAYGVYGTFTDIA